MTSKKKETEIKAVEDSALNDPMLKIEEDFTKKKYGEVCESNELDLFKVSNFSG